MRSSSLKSFVKLAKKSTVAGIIPTLVVGAFTATGTGKIMYPSPSDSVKINPGLSPIASGLHSSSSRAVSPSVVPKTQLPRKANVIGVSSISAPSNTGSSLSQANEKLATYPGSSGLVQPPSVTTSSNGTATASNLSPATATTRTMELSAELTSATIPAIEPIGGKNIVITSFINVVDYGADPTGQSDSTNAIIAAIAAAESLNDHATVYFPAGRYILTRPLNRLFDFVVSSPLNLVGAGQGLTVIENEVGIDTGATVPPGMFKISGSGGPTPGGADGTIIGDMTLDVMTYQSGTAVTDYGNNTTIGNLTVYAPTSTNKYNPNQFGIRVIAVCNPTNIFTNYRVGNLVQNVYIAGNGWDGNTELDISCQENTTVNGATIVGNGVDIYMSRDDSLSNLKLTGGNNGAANYFTWVITDSQNINLTNVVTTGQPGVIEQSSGDTTSNVVINNEVSNSPAAHIRIGDALDTTIENSNLGGIYLDPSRVLDGLTVQNSTFGNIYCVKPSYIRGLSGLECP
ncbi:MAG: glycosyl hydrolase family 28-related protein [Actinomycetota bacterium]|nr:glycosyl hydrolase family 28-related protein [Actinomycetota bacterium]